MCGIAGIFDFSGRPDAACAQVLRRMMRTLVYRRPDDEGYYLDNHLGLGHRRLSIIDLSTGQQPLSKNSPARSYQHATRFGGSHFPLRRRRAATPRSRCRRPPALAGGVHARAHDGVLCRAV